MPDHTGRSDLLGKRALVTGASRGIGLEIATLLADAGADVGIVGRNAGAWKRRGKPSQSWTACRQRDRPNRLVRLRPRPRGTRRASRLRKSGLRALERDDD